MSEPPVITPIRSIRLTANTALELQGKAMLAGDLLIWTVYERPRDFPDFYVARPFCDEQGRPEYLAEKKLDHLRHILAWMGLSCLTRCEGDDSVIVETWL